MLSYTQDWQKNQSLFIIYSLKIQIRTILLLGISSSNFQEFKMSAVHILKFTIPESVKIIMFPKIHMLRVIFLSPYVQSVIVLYIIHPNTQWGLIHLDANNPENPTSGWYIKLHFKETRTRLNTYYFNCWDWKTSAHTLVSNPLSLQVNKWQSYFDKERELKVQPE